MCASTPLHIAGFGAVPLEPAAAVAAAAADDPPAAAEPSCRVCWEEADGEDGGALLTPCECLGTQRFVHQRCLQEWMQVGGPRRPCRNSVTVADSTTICTV